MSSSPTTFTPLATFRNDSPYPFCPGCGHGLILNQLNAALVKLRLDPRQVVLVTDIGCAGLSDQYFLTNAFHGLHGRSITYATGVKLARPELTVIVVMGDGGTGIGGAHLLSAARRNVGITVLVFNNLNFGMTGGQHSTTTPLGALTSTTRLGNLERPLDLCSTVAVNGGAYVCRATSFDSDLPERIAEAIETPGFALLDIWELCTAYYVSSNRFSRKALFATLEELGLPTGVLHRRAVAEYARAYRAAHAPLAGEAVLAPRPLAVRFASPLAARRQVVVAGSAGGKVRSAVRLVAQAAILSGLFAAQRDDYPVTVQTGHSISELVLAPQAFHYSGIERPDVLLALSAEGVAKAARHLAAMTEEDRVFALPGLAGLATRARVTLLDPHRAPLRVSRHNEALVALTAMLQELGYLPLDALEEAARHGSAELLGNNLEAIRGGRALADLR